MDDDTSVVNTLAVLLVMVLVIAVVMPFVAKPIIAGRAYNQGAIDAHRGVTTVEHVESDNGEMLWVVTRGDK